MIIPLEKNGINLLILLSSSVVDKKIILTRYVNIWEHERYIFDLVFERSCPSSVTPDIH